MASIGAYTMLTIKGGLGVKGEHVEVFARPGVNGHAAKKLGTRSRDFYLETWVDLTTADQRRVVYNAYRGMMGSLVTVVDDYGRTDSNVLVLDVWLLPDGKYVATPVGGVIEGNYLLHCGWRLMVP